MQYWAVKIKIKTPIHAEKPVYRLSSPPYFPVEEYLSS